MAYGGWSSDRFDENMESFKCGICLEVQRDAMASDCGHSYCQLCITRSAHFFQNKCPSCRTITTQLAPDFKSRMIINGKPIRCKYEGCLFKDAVSRIFQHEFICEYQLVSCKDCKEMVCQKDMGLHLSETCEYRKIECTYCEEPIPFLFMDKHIKKDCPLFVVQCQYCPFSCIRKEFNVHKQECLECPMDCPYQRYGCTFHSLRKEMKLHQQETDHLLMVTRHLELWKKNLKEQLHVHLDGPFRVDCHQHSVMLCSDGEHEDCDKCEKSIEKDIQWFFYKCTKGCDYQLCTSCLREQRLYKSKKDNLSLFFLQL